MKMVIVSAIAAVSLVGCATYDDDYDYRGAPGTDNGVIYDEDGVRYDEDGVIYEDAGDLPSPGGLDRTRRGPMPPQIAPPHVAPSGNALRRPEPAPRFPTEAVPPQ